MKSLNLHLQFYHDYIYKIIIILVIIIMVIIGREIAHLISITRSNRDINYFFGRKHNFKYF